MVLNGGNFCYIGKMVHFQFHVGFQYCKTCYLIILSSFSVTLGLLACVSKSYLTKQVLKLYLMNDECKRK